MPQRWSGKSSAHRLWFDINKFVDAYVTEHQEELHSPWFRKWYELYRTASLADESTPIELASFVFLNKQNATIHEIVCYLFTWIPNLESYLVIHQVGE